MAKIKSPEEYRKKLEKLNEIRARPEKPVRIKRKLEGEVGAYGLELKGKETRRPKQTPTPRKVRRPS